MAVVAAATATTAAVNRVAVDAAVERWGHLRFVAGAAELSCVRQCQACTDQRCVQRIIYEISEYIEQYVSSSVECHYI